MMYSRYVPDASGVYRQTTLEQSPPPSPPPAPPEAAFAPQSAPCAPAPPPEHAGRSLKATLERLLPRGMDAGDLLVLLILLLLYVDGEQEDSLSLILTAAAFLLL